MKKPELVPFRCGHQLDKDDAFTFHLMQLSVAPWTRRPIAQGRAAQVVGNLADSGRHSALAHNDSGEFHVSPCRGCISAPGGLGLHG